MPPRRKSKAKGAFVRPEQTSALANLPHELLVGIIMDSVRDEDGAADDLFKLHDRLEPLMLCRSLAAAIGAVLDDSTVAIGEGQVEKRRRGVVRAKAGPLRAARTRQIAIEASGLRPAREAIAKLLSLLPHLERVDMRFEPEQRFVLENPLRDALIGVRAMATFVYEGSPRSPWLTLEDLLVLVHAWVHLVRFEVHAQIGTQRFAATPPSTAPVAGRHPLRHLVLGHGKGHSPVVMDVAIAVCSAAAADLETLSLSQGVGNACREQAFAALIRKHAPNLKALCIGVAVDDWYGDYIDVTVGPAIASMRPLLPQLSHFELVDVSEDVDLVVSAAARMTTGTATVHVRLVARTSDAPGREAVAWALQSCRVIDLRKLSALIIVRHFDRVRRPLGAFLTLAVFRSLVLDIAALDGRGGRYDLRRHPRQGRRRPTDQDRSRRVMDGR